MQSFSLVLHFLSSGMTFFQTRYVYVVLGYAFGIELTIIKLNGNANNFVLLFGIKSLKL